MAMFKIWVAVTVALYTSLFTFFYRTWHQFPVPEEGLKYYLQNEFYENRVDLKEPNWRDIRINSNATLFVIIHGYTESSNRPWISNLTKALLVDDPKSSVLILDYWNYLSLRRPYMKDNIQKTSKEFAQFLQEFCHHKQILFKQIHILPFSLGGQVAGSLPAYLSPSNKIGRITGIDPSYPWKETSDPNDFLDSTDADLVIAIRSSRVGHITPYVDVDFFVNGRVDVQPGCCNWYKLDFVCQLCSHYRAIKLVEEVLIREKKFMACRCSKDSLMPKEHCSSFDENLFGLMDGNVLKGLFCLVTNSQPPFLL